MSQWKTLEEAAKRNPMFLLPAALRDDLMRYLASKPYGEVAAAIAALSQLETDGGGPGVPDDK